MHLHQPEVFHYVKLWICELVLKISRQASGLQMTEEKEEKAEEEDDDRYCSHAEDEVFRLRCVQSLRLDWRNHFSTRIIIITTSSATEAFVNNHWHSSNINYLFIYLIRRSSNELSLNNTYNTMVKLLQITVIRPFKTLPHARLYFSPRSYQQITFNIQLTCQRTHVILTSDCKPTHNRIIKHHQPLSKK